MNNDQTSPELNNPLTDAKPGTTHILITYASQAATNLFRASDGMMIGMRSASGVKWGIRPETSQQRVFMNEACATEALKAAAKDDLAATTKARCIFPVGQTTCGYQHDSHVRGDGSPMSHLFTPGPDVAEPVFEERDGESKIEIPSPHLLRRN